MIQLLCFGDCHPSLTDGCMVWGLLALRCCLWCSAVTGHEFLSPKLQKVGSHLPLRCWPWRGYSSNTSFTLRPEKPIINWVGVDQGYTAILQIYKSTTCLFVCLPFSVPHSLRTDITTRRHSFMVTPVPQDAGSIMQAWQNVGQEGHAATTAFEKGYAGTCHRRSLHSGGRHLQTGFVLGKLRFLPSWHVPGNYFKWNEWCRQLGGSMHPKLAS